jgi:oxygen-independent coproporphyrinogen III oxidase
MRPTLSTNRYSREVALASIDDQDPQYPISHTAALLRRPENAHLLEYVFEETFTHVFPGDSAGYSPDDFSRYSS